MRVVLVVPSFPKLSESFIVSKFLGLWARGWDVHIVCSESLDSQWQNFPDLQNQPAVRRRVKVAWPHRPKWLAASLIPLAVARCGLANPAGTWRYLSKGSSRFGGAVLRRFYLDAGLVALKPDLIHFEFGALAVGRMYLKSLLGCRIVVSFRGYDLNLSGLDQPAYYRDVWERADSLHLLGRDLWNRARRRGCPADKSHVLIPPAINVKFFDAVDRSCHRNGARQTLRLLSVGRLEWKKGYEYALQSIRRLRDRGIDCAYRIIGSGKMLEALAYARHQLGLTDSVELVGALPHPKVKAEMAQADVFLHAAVSEGFCNAVLEAQAMRLPVVCTDADGLSENVLDGETGFVVPRRNPEAMAEKLAHLAASPDLRRKMGEAGRQRVCSHFRIEDQISSFDRWYGDVLGSTYG